MATTIKTPTQAPALVPVANLIHAHAHERVARFEKAVSARLIDAFSKNGKNMNLENLLPVIAVLEKAAVNHNHAAVLLKNKHASVPGISMAQE